MKYFQSFYRASICFALIAVLVAGCGGAGPAGTTRRARATLVPTATPLPPLPTLPPPGSEENPLTLIFVNAASDSVESTAQELQQALEEETGLVIKVEVTDNYALALQRLCDGSAAVISANTFSYLSAKERGCAEGLFVAEVNGELSTQGQMITDARRDIFTVKGFRGYTFCRSSPESVSGWIIPALSLRVNQMNPLTDVQVIDVGSDEEVIKTILTKGTVCQVGATEFGAEKDVTTSGKIEVIEPLPPAPNDTIMISTNLDRANFALMSDTLAGYQDELADLIGADSLSPSDDTAFDELRALLLEADVDVSSMGQ